MDLTGKTLTELESLLGDTSLSPEDKIKVIGEKSRRERISSSLKAKDKIAAALADHKSFGDMRSYQVAGIHFITSRLLSSNSAILGDDPGLGKTAQAAIALDLYAQLAEETNLRILYLTKRTLVTATAVEIMKWTNNLLAFPVDPQGPGSTRQILKAQIDLARGLPGNTVVVTNYESLNSFKAQLTFRDWDILVVDEVHKLRGGANPPKQRTKVWLNTKDLSHRVDKFIFLSGSLINNKPEELWAFFNILDPIKFNDYGSFRQMFLDAKTLKLDMDKIIKIIGPMLLMRTKRDVLDDLPPLTEIIHPCYYTEGQKEMVLKLEQELLLWVEDQPGDSIPIDIFLEQITRLRQISVYPGRLKGEKKMRDPFTMEEVVIPFDLSWGGNGKLEQILEDTEEILDAGENLVLFSCTFNAPLHWLEEALSYTREVELLTGKTKNPWDVVQRFQQDKIQVLLANLAAAGEGFNLQKHRSWPGGASHVGFIDGWWNPQVIDKQGVGRIERVGVPSPLFAHYWEYPTGVDPYMRDVRNKKRKHARDWLGHESFSVTKEDIEKFFG